jgi:hypothetical protein
MKKLIMTISLIGAFCLTSKSQTNNLGIFGTLGQDIDNSGILNATNYAFAPYATYAPSAPKGRQWGGGLLAIYNVNNYAGMALGGDFLGQFTMVSGNATLQLPIQPLKTYSFLPDSIKNVQVVPFGLIGVGKTLSGGGSTFASITDIGGAIKFGHLLGGQFGTGYSYGRWDNAGIYSGVRHHLFLDWSYGF